jgi:uncharacterized membrane protein YphA (DoxX/SURF4 family)/very-short-patch-repair endonuclease
MAAGSAKRARRKRAVRAAWLWARSAGAVVTGEAAAFWHGMLDRAPASVELTLPRAAHRRGRPGVEMRRRDLQAPDVIERREIAVADAPLAALETAVALPRGSVFLDRALQRHVRFPAVYRCYCRNVGRHGSAAMHRMLVAAADRADSAAERLLVRLLREAGIGGWVLGYPFGPYRIDLAFPAERVAIEVDGWAWHVDAERSQGDHRTVALRSTGRAPTQAREATRGSRQVTTLSVVVPSLGVKPPESTYAAEPTAAEWGSPSGWIIRRGTRCCPSAERFSGEGVRRPKPGAAAERTSPVVEPLDVRLMWVPSLLGEGVRRNCRRPDPGGPVRQFVSFADRLCERVRRVRALGWFAWAVRVLLAVAFVPSGLTKVLGTPFTRLDPQTSDVGRLFAALQQDFGGLYSFVGACQLAAAVLLLIPRTTLVGALVHLPITAGIVVITTTVGFRGTWLIAWLMLLGLAYLICWDWHRVKALWGPELLPADVQR